MAARIVHFGLDECSRVLVLQRAGYDVEVCPDSLRELNHLLQEPADAVVLSENGTEHVVEAASLSRSITLAPIVLFKDAASFRDDSTFDIVIPALTPPAQWLERIAEVIKHNHTLRQ
jgi:hypothetical protein